MSTEAAWAALPLILFVMAALTGVGVLVAQPWLKASRRSRIRARPFPARWRAILRRRVPLAARLPADLQIRLRRHMLVFLAEKPFIGCQGQVVTDEVRVTIAAHACLLLIGHERPDCYPRLRQVLVYPYAFVVDRQQPVGAGLVQEQRRSMVGESWNQGQVILSWAEVVAGAADPGDGRNVALHEFAHQIDQDSGTADGRPWRADPEARRRWAMVMGAAFERLRSQPSAVIDDYGASEPAEFFAVATEAFFERPQELAAEAPAVYDELVTLYGVDPRQW